MFKGESDSDQCSEVNLKLEFVQIRTGEWKLKSSDGSEEDIPVKSIIVHPQYNQPLRFQHDIALIELAQAANMTSKKKEKWFKTKIECLFLDIGRVSGHRQSRF